MEYSVFSERAETGFRDFVFSVLVSGSSSTGVFGVAEGVARVSFVRGRRVLSLRFRFFFSGFRVFVFTEFFWLVFFFYV